MCHYACVVCCILHKLINRLLILLTTLALIEHYLPELCDSPCFSSVILAHMRSLFFIFSILCDFTLGKLITAHFPTEYVKDSLCERVPALI